MCFVVHDNEVRLLPMRPIGRLFGALKHHGPLMSLLEDMERGIAEGACEGRAAANCRGDWRRQRSLQARAITDARGAGREAVEEWSLNTNVLVRYLVEDDAAQESAVRTFLELITPEQPAFICCEVMLELVWVLQRTYCLPRDRIARVLEELVGTEGLEVEAAKDVVRAASRCRRGEADFSDLMIAYTAERHRASSLYTFDQQLARVDGAFC